MDTYSAALTRLRDLGVDHNDLYQDYYKIPLENIDISKNEMEHPTKTKITSKHTIIIDSRQRDYSLYPNPGDYLIDLMCPYRNVERIELIAAMLPKTEYNVNTENNLLLVTINGVKEELYLTPGQYIIGTNNTSVHYISNGNLPTFGLICELSRVLNLHTQSSSTFNVFLATTPQTGNNASVLNRINITNSSVNFSIDFTNTNYSSDSPFRILGFYKQVYYSNLSSVIYGNDNFGNCSSADLTSGTTHVVNIQSIQSIFDYDLMDDPKYIIMQLKFGNNSAERTESIDIATNQKFAIVIYDSNEPDNIHTFPGSNGGNVQMNVDRRPGRLKALKGSDFDKKIITFTPSITIENFAISFYKYNNTLYDFHNREHLLTFEIDVIDGDIY
jgi:hypothetical protein